MTAPPGATGTWAAAPSTVAVTRHRVARDDGADFLAMARTAVESMSRCQGHLCTSVGRALDDPELWLITSVWDSVGAYRRALSSYDVKVAASSLLASAVDDVNVFETLLEVSQNGTVEGTSSLSEDPGR